MRCENHLPTYRVAISYTNSMIGKMDIRYSKQATKYLLKLQPKKAKKIREVVKSISAENTDGLNITTMHGLDAYRVRVGDFRVIYEIRDEELVLIVIKIGVRGDVYK